MSESEKTKDEVFIRSGLAKSSFRETIYEGLPWQYYMPYVTETQKLTRSLSNILPRIYQSHDAFMMFYKPYELVYISLKKMNKAAPLWHSIVSEAIKEEKFYDVNKFTAGSSELATLAAYQFLRNLFRKLPLNEKLRDSIQRRISSELKAKNITDPQKAQEIIQEVLGSSDWKATKDSAKDAVASAFQALQEYKEAKEEAEGALAALPTGGPGGLGFAKEALSVLHFLQNPDDYRKRVRLLKYARVFTARFSTTLPTSFSHEQLASPAGGVYGVGRMNSHTKLSDILPSELALVTGNQLTRALFAVKLASQQLTAYQHATAVKPILFIDKSGSMAGTLGDVPKISVAAGLAFAMHRKFDAPVYLFDTELTAVKPKDIINTLLTIEADGGTYIVPVLKEIMRIGKKEYLYIIISDGITSADDFTLKDFRNSGLASRTKLILIPPASEDYDWVQLLKQYGNVQYAEDVAQFEKAVKSALG